MKPKSTGMHGQHRRAQGHQLDRQTPGVFTYTEVVNDAHCRANQVSYAGFGEAVQYGLQRLVDHPSLGRPFLIGRGRDMVATPALFNGRSRLEPDALPTLSTRKRTRFAPSEFCRV